MLIRHRHYSSSADLANQILVKMVPRCPVVFTLITNTAWMSFARTTSMLARARAESLHLLPRFYIQICAMKAKPFVKWAGGKGRIIGKLEEKFPKDIKQQKEITYIEPFVGGGAMLFHMLQEYTNIKRVIINDINKDLVKCYELIKDNPEILIEELKQLEDSFYSHVHPQETEYYTNREEYKSIKRGTVRSAALFIFLNHTCFNGLYRVNSKGEFNVPFGRYKKPIICNKDLINEIHELFERIELKILSGDYKSVEKEINKNEYTFVYFDPPYRPLNTTSYFKEYSNSPFNDDQQEELKVFCDTLTNEHRCKIMLSNSNSLKGKEPYFKNLFKAIDEYNEVREVDDTSPYFINDIPAPRCINAFATKRTQVKEILIRNYSIL